MKAWWREVLAAPRVFLTDGGGSHPQGTPHLRAVRRREARRAGTIRRLLGRLDPAAAARIHPNDPQRVNRAVEVYRLTGKSLTELTEHKGEPFPYQVQQFAINPTDRSELHQRIAVRFRQMLDSGFADEVKTLMQRTDLHLDLPSMRCVGYRQMWLHLQGQLSEQEMIDQGIAATRQLAKRQLTWLRSWPELNWLKTEDKQAENLQAILTSLS